MKGLGRFYTLLILLGMSTTYIPDVTLKPDKIPRRRIKKTNKGWGWAVSDKDYIKDHNGFKKRITLGRNEPCHCGSGSKYKNCGLKHKCL